MHALGQISYEKGDLLKGGLTGRKTSSWMGRLKEDLGGGSKGGERRQFARIPQYQPGVLARKLIRATDRTACHVSVYGAPYALCTQRRSRRGTNAPAFIGGVGEGRGNRHTA